MSLSANSYSLQQDPTNPWNYAAVGADLAGTALPGVPAFGLGIKAVEKGVKSGAVKEAAKQIVKQSDNIVKGANESKKVVYEYTTHALNQMQARKITAKVVDKVIEKANPFPYFHKGDTKIGYFNEKTRIFVGTIENRITTVINKVKDNYIKNLKNNKR